MKFDYSKLRGRIVEKYGTLAKFAEAMGWTQTTLSRKLSHSSFNVSNIIKMSELLGLSGEDIGAYFFTQKVQFSELSKEAF